MATSRRNPSARRQRRPRAVGDLEPGRRPRRPGRRRSPARRRGPPGCPRCAWRPGRNWPRPPGWPRCCARRATVARWARRRPGAGPRRDAAPAGVRGRRRGPRSRARGGRRGDAGRRWRPGCSSRARKASRTGGEVLVTGTAEQVLTAWDAALEVLLAADDLDGLATALYTVGGPVRMDALFDAYSAAAGTRRGRAGRRPSPTRPRRCRRCWRRWPTSASWNSARRSPAGGLTVALSPLGRVGRAPPAAGPGLARPGARRGEPLRGGRPAGHAGQLRRGGRRGGDQRLARGPGPGPGGRGADRGGAAADHRACAAPPSPCSTGSARPPCPRFARPWPSPVLRAHAAVWLHEHGEQAELRPEDRTWLLVDLGAGLLEEADPRDVVAELLPDVPPDAQAEIVAGPVAGPPSGRDRPADRAERAPSRSRRWPGRRARPRSRPVAVGGAPGSIDLSTLAVTRPQRLEETGERQADTPVRRSGAAHAGRAGA